MLIGLLCLSASIAVLVKHSGNDNWTIEILAVVLFGSIFITVVSDLFIRGPVLIIDAEGVWDKRMSPRPIPWQQIGEVDLVVKKMFPFVCLDLADPGPYLPPFYTVRGIGVRLDAAFGHPPMKISTLTLKGRATEILAAVLRHRAQALESSSSRR